MKLKTGKMRKEQKDKKLTKTQQRKVSDIFNRVNEAWKHRRPYNAEYR